MITSYQILKTIFALVFVSGVALVVLRSWGHLLGQKSVLTKPNQFGLRCLQSEKLGDQHSLHIIGIGDDQKLLLSSGPAGTVVHGEIVDGNLVPLSKDKLSCNETMQRILSSK